MTSKETGTGFGIGFIVGVAVGLAVGFLYAPRPGVETREQLKEKVAEVKEKASEVGFDWDNIADVLKKLDEEVAEFKDALKEKSRDEIEDEIGDMLFVMVRTSNFVNVDPEDALRRSIAKFIRRFNYMETEASGQGRKLTDMTLDEMGLLWNRAKAGMVRMCQIYRVALPQVKRRKRFWSY